MNSTNSTRISTFAKVQGFTLIELMITIIIIGILAAIAIPSYTRYVVKGDRAAAQAEMMDIAGREQQYLLANRAYTATLSDISYTALPTRLATKYTLTGVDITKYLDSSCTPQTATGTAPTFVITLTPISTSSQASDGPLYLSNTGTKCPANKW